MAWDIIKEEIMDVFHQFYSLSGENFARINSALIALLPKKDGAEAMEDFRPISLINSIAKRITKVLHVSARESWLAHLAGAERVYEDEVPK